MPPAAGIPSSLEGKPVAARGGASPGALHTGSVTVWFQEEVYPLWAAGFTRGLLPSLCGGADGGHGDEWAGTWDTNTECQGAAEGAGRLGSRCEESERLWCTLTTETSRETQAGSFAAGEG